MLHAQVGVRRTATAADHGRDGVDPPDQEPAVGLRDGAAVGIAPGGPDRERRGVGGGRRGAGRSGEHHTAAAQQGTHPRAHSSSSGDHGVHGAFGQTWRQQLAPVARCRHRVAGAGVDLPARWPASDQVGVAHLLHLVAATAPGAWRPGRPCRAPRRCARRCRCGWCAQGGRPAVGRPARDGGCRVPVAVGVERVDAAGRSGRRPGRTAGCRARGPAGSSRTSRSPTMTGCGEPNQRLSVPQTTRCGPTCGDELAEQVRELVGAAHDRPHGGADLGVHVGHVAVRQARRDEAARVVAVLPQAS